MTETQHASAHVTTDAAPGTRLRLVTGRLARPSAQGPIAPTEYRPPGAISFGAMQAIAGGLVRVQPAVIPALDVPGHTRSTRLLVTALYDAWLVTWPDGFFSGLHDHGGVRSVLRVVEGELVEIITDLVDDVPPLVRVLRRGDITWGKASLTHDLTNRSGAEVTTLHVYSPPLDDIVSHDRQIIGREPRRREGAVDGRGSRIGGGEPSPLSLVLH